MAARKKAGSKRQASRKGQSASSKGLPGPALLVIGMVLGLGLAWLIAILGFTPTKTPQTASPETNSGGEEIAAAPDQASGLPERKPRYDFYTVLPEMEVVVPEAELRASTAAVQPEEGVAYVLQVGSFQSGADADTLKAQLALLGLETYVQDVQVDNRTWHRVRVGPLPSKRDVERVRRQLEEQELRPIVLREQR